MSARSGPTRCANCGASVMEQHRFCAHCGTEIPSQVQLPCGHFAGADSKYCPQCGLAVHRRPHSGQQEHVPAGSEIRFVSIVSVDIVESTRLAGGMQLEHYRTLTRRFQSECRAIVESKGGYVAHFAGDGIVAIFGHPRAVDSHALRAVESCLEILDAYDGREVETDTGRRPVRIRAGCHVGSVFVDTASEDVETLPQEAGYAIAIAVRVESAAAPGTVFVTQQCWELVEGFFDAEEMGVKELKGVSSPPSLFKINHRLAVADRFHLALSRGLNPIVGRDEEMLHLLREWERVGKGAGSAVLVTGEPGIGKSRLVEELKSMVDQTGGTWAIFYGEEDYKNTPYHPFRSILDDDHRSVDTDQVLNEVAALDRRRSIEKSILEHLYEHDSLPKLLVVEDLHWVDPSSSDLIRKIVLDGPLAGILVMATTRPQELRDTWDLGRYSILNLRQIGEADSWKLASQLDINGALSDKQIESIVSTSGGVPLYLEECLKNAVSRVIVGEEDSDPLEVDREVVPPTLRGAIVSRLDKLGAVKRVAQIAAVIGSSFDTSLLAHVVGDIQDDFGPFPDLTGAVEQLVRSDITVMADAHRGGVFQFKHVLMQQCAYRSLPPSALRRIHRVVAECMEKDSGPERPPEILAQHWYSSEGYSRAVELWQLAADRAAERFANREAIAHLEAALTVIGRHLDEEDRKLLEKSTRLRLLVPLVAETGWASERFVSNCETLMRLTDELGDSAGALSSRRMLFNASLLRAEPSYREHLDWILGYARDSNTREDWALAYRTEGAASMFMLGDPIGAYGQLTKAEELFDPTLDRKNLGIFDLDPEVATMSLRSWLLYYLKKEEEARVLAANAVSAARNLGQPFSNCYALCLSASTLLSLGDSDETLAHAKEALVIAERFEMTYWQSYSRILQGGALVRSSPSEALTKLQVAVKEYRSTGARMLLPWASCLEARAYLSLGDAHAALDCLWDTASSAVRLFREEHESLHERALRELAAGR